MESLYYYVSLIPIVDSYTIYEDYVFFEDLFKTQMSDLLSLNLQLESPLELDYYL